MNSFYVIVYDVNGESFVPYDVIPYLKECYCEAKDKPKTLEEFKDFIKVHSLYQWWSRCEYEVILCGWPNTDTNKKVDVYWQIMMNIDIITELFIKHIQQ